MMPVATRNADGSWPLMETPSAKKDVSTHPAHHIANEMSFAHNAMIRGLNALYLQSPHIPPSTHLASDFLFFAASWSAWVLHHHILEETQMFPGFESVPGVPEGFLQGNVEQHHAFSAGLEEFNEWVRTTGRDAYDGIELRRLIDKFADPLYEHLNAEIPTLWALDCVSATHSAQLLQVYKDCEKEAAKQDPFVVPPMVMGLCDATFQGGNDWPRMPFGAAWVIYWVLGWRHRGAWRFLPSDGYRRPRALAFLGKK
ncbi:hypothetical protein BCR34DRAFT_572470 [Clohesyomyces aquaticus]|uniref:Hemerythrin-like domain-containing protein n=1 Tax=Clohesyomyces aquaticus TaxID=1231657 RepID=A0A1Y1Z3B7_9PLEO|nr:hypothetical protein BCR34DRAFT_572470 [Clohesyomyces aquaticus]